LAALSPSSGLSDVPALALGLSRLDAKMPKASMKMKVRLYPQFPSAKRESMNNPPMP
jgi:hypothetical protein